VTKMLEQAFERASKLPQADQDALAAWLIEELDAEPNAQKTAVSEGRKTIWRQEESNTTWDGAH